jgi:hypothetical protein
MSENQTGEEKQATPPYLPFKTLKRLISKFQETTVPQRIDISALQGFSGSDRSALLPALKYLGLVDNEQMATHKIMALVNSYAISQEWKKQLNKIITDSYADIINELDLTTATRKQLEEKFKNVSTSPAVKQKCIRFYISAAKEADIGLSKHITARQTVKGEKRAPRNKPKEKSQQVNNHEKGDVPKPPAIDPKTLGYEEFTAPIKGHQPIKVWFPNSVTKQEWESARRQLEVIHAMVKNFFGFSDEEEKK